MTDKNKTKAEAHAMTAEAHATKFNQIYNRWKHKKLMRAAIENNKIQFIEIK